MKKLFIVLLILLPSLGCANWKYIEIKQFIHEEVISPFTISGINEKIVRLSISPSQKEAIIVTEKNKVFKINKKKDIQEYFVSLSVLINDYKNVKDVIPVYGNTDDVVFFIVISKDVSDKEYNVRYMLVDKDDNWRHHIYSAGIKNLNYGWISSIVDWSEDDYCYKFEIYNTRGDDYYSARTNLMKDVKFPKKRQIYEVTPKNDYTFSEQPSYPIITDARIIKARIRIIYKEKKPFACPVETFSELYKFYLVKEGDVILDENNKECGIITKIIEDTNELYKRIPAGKKSNIQKYIDIITTDFKKLKEERKFQESLKLLANIELLDPLNLNVEHERKIIGELIKEEEKNKQEKFLAEERAKEEAEKRKQEEENKKYAGKENEALKIFKESKHWKQILSSAILDNLVIEEPWVSKQKDGSIYDLRYNYYPRLLPSEKFQVIFYINVENKEITCEGVVPFKK